MNKMYVVISSCYVCSRCTERTKSHVVGHGVSRLLETPSEVSAVYSG